MVLRPVIPTVRPFRAGAICLFAGLALALAAGTLGLGPDSVRHGFWHREFFEARGGIAGEGLFWVASTLFQNIGAHILAIFLLLASALLLTGASVGGVIAATRTSVAETTRSLRRQPTVAPDRGPLLPPEPDDRELIVTRHACGGAAVAVGNARARDRDRDRDTGDSRRGRASRGQRRGHRGREGAQRAGRHR